MDFNVNVNIKHGQIQVPDWARFIYTGMNQTMSAYSNGVGLQGYQV